MREDSQDEWRRHGWMNTPAGLERTGDERWAPQEPMRPLPRHKRSNWPAWALAGLVALYLIGIFVVIPLLIQGRL